MFKRLKIAACAALIGAVPVTASAVPSLDFIIDGNTFTNPFSFSNTADAGETLTGFGIDLSGAGSLCFDTVDGGPCNSSPNFAGAFSPDSGAGATGFVSSTVVDGGTTLDLVFNDFDSGETFAFDIDVDFASPGGFTVLGSDMIGATAYADFSDGQRLIGVFQAVVGNSDASSFTVTGVVSQVPLPAGFLLLLSGLGVFGVIKARKSVTA